MPSQASLLRLIRQTHLYLGTFIAPAILFFAFTGALQTFSLHDNAKNYKAPHWIVVLAQIHKKQTDQIPPSKLPSLASSHGDASHKPEKTAAPVPAVAPSRHPLPLKVFFLVVCVGLFTSTFSGLYMTYKYSRSKLLVAMLLVAGTIVPVLFTFI
jgi:uncharacterized iron-regulated membrane protein